MVCDYFTFLDKIRGMQNHLSGCIASTPPWMEDNKKIIVRILTPTAMANGWRSLIIVPVVMHRVWIMVIILICCPVCVAIATALAAAAAVAVAMVIHRDRIVNTTVLIVMWSGYVRMPMTISMLIVCVLGAVLCDIVDIVSISYLMCATPTLLKIYLLVMIRVRMIVLSYRPMVSTIGEYCYRRLFVR